MRLNFLSFELPAQPVAEVSANEIILHFGEGKAARRWRVRGLAKNLAYEVLKVNVLAHDWRAQAAINSGVNECPQTAYQADGTTS